MPSWVSGPQKLKENVKQMYKFLTFYCRKFWLNEAVLTYRLGRQIPWEEVSPVVK